MKKWIHASEATDKFAIGIIDDKSDKVLGYVSGYRKGGYYHPGSVVMGTYDLNEYVKMYDTEQRAQRVMAQYRGYSEIFMYDPTSADYPQPSEKWSKRDVPTHLEVVSVD